MPTMTVLPTLQDYLRAIYTLEKESGQISTSLLAERLEVSQPSVTSMLKKLAARKLISYTPYMSIALTIAGQRLALEAVRHHRLIETYLQRALGLGLDEVDGEAERLEHAISEKLEAKIDSYLGHPAFDPHGSPIPDREGRVRKRSLVPLASLHPGETAVIAQVISRDAAQLRYMESKGLLPGASVRMKDCDPGSGVMQVVLGSGAQEPVGESLSRCVLLTKERTGSPRG